MRNIFLLPVSALILSILMMSGTVWGQIAAPRLNPIAFDSSIITPNRPIPAFNPAVIPWSGASRIAAGQSDLEVEFTFGGVTASVNTGDGPMVQGRYVGEFFSFAAEINQVGIVDSATGATTDFDGSLIAAALRFGDMVSVGVSQQSVEFVDATTSDSLTLPLLGATLRLGETFFLGISTGDETIENVSGGTTVSGDRTVTQIGLAYLSRDGENGLHLEYYRQTADAITDPSITQEEGESAAFTLEVIFSNILLGYESLGNETVDTSGNLVDDISMTTISLGWVPEQGLTLVASLIQEETITTTFVFNIDTTMIAVGWAF